MGEIRIREMIYITITQNDITQSFVAKDFQELRHEIHSAIDKVEDQIKAFEQADCYLQDKLNSVD